MPREGFIRVVDISVNGEIIESFNIPDRLPEDKMLDYFFYENIKYEINFKSLTDGVRIIILTESEDNNLNDFELNTEYHQEISQKIKITLYIPTAPFTNTLSTALYGLTDNEKVLPMIDIENKTKFDNYVKDELLNFKHYLDLSSMKYTTNQPDREEAKALRKREKHQTGMMSTCLPEIIEEQMPLQDIIGKFNNIPNKNNVIPVYLWDDNASLDKLQKFHSELSKMGYIEFAIRILTKDNFIKDIMRIKSICGFTIFTDLNTNFSVDYIKQYLETLINHFDDIVYLGSHFLPSQMTISRNDVNINNIRDNIPILVYKELTKAYPSLNYGDYCGFDRKTLSSMPKGGRPTARVILESLDDSAKILIRRGWDSNDETFTQSGDVKIGVTNSMLRLLNDIQKGLLDKFQDKLFMDSSICDADNALKTYYPDKASPGEVKTLCIRHNVYSVIHNYM
ncbi:MAG: hypothetical protein ACYCT7_03150 [bacterium]